MTILCGTDFSAPSLEAARAAAALARVWKQELVLAHAAEPSDADLAPGAGDEPSRAAGERLRQAAQRLDEGGRVRTELLGGFPDQELPACAERVGAELIAVGALGRRFPAEWALGSTADRIARGARVPVLVARSAAPFEAWSRGERPLRVLVCVDLSESSDAAVRWTSELCARATCAPTAAHVYWPPEVREQLGLPPAKHGPAGERLPIGTVDREVEQALERKLSARLAPLGKQPAVRLVGGLGRVADHLVQLAAEEHADLVVVGKKKRTGLQRFWHGSVSHGVLDLARTNVACVPA
jgi:nucleotide-binding universal stress UspA family protein